MATRRRRRRYNAWFGAPLLHRKAGRLGAGRRRSKNSSKKRRTRRNAGSLFGQTVSAAKSGFKGNVLKTTGVILGGNILTTWSAEKIMGALPVLSSNKILNVLTVGVTAGLAGLLAQKVKYTRKYANGIFIGGMLAAVTRGVRELAPGILPSSCLGDDMDGLGFDNSFVFGPAGAMDARVLDGIGSYAHFGQRVRQGTNGISDYGSYPQVQRPVQLDGMDALGEELEMTL